MKSTVFALIFFFVQIALAKPINTGWFSSDAVKGYDTVAYFTAGKAVKGQKEFTFNWNGADWKFSSKKNLELFKASPNKYAPQYGGYCAYAMADGKKVSIDPKSFDVRDGKLYLNYSKGVQKKWKAEIKSYIENADAAWKKID
jgi:YHS domain-containing protein